MVGIFGSGLTGLKIESRLRGLVPVPVKPKLWFWDDRLVPDLVKTPTSDHLAAAIRLITIGVQGGSKGGGNFNKLIKFSKKLLNFFKSSGNPIGAACSPRPTNFQRLNERKQKIVKFLK